MSKFKLERCPNGGTNCRSLVFKMNDLLGKASNAIAGNDYRRAFSLSMAAYNETFSITNEQCQKCTDMFQAVIMKSVEEQIEELYRMTTGVMKRKSYFSLLHQAEALLKEMEQNQRQSA